MQRPIVIYASEIAKLIRCTDFAKKDIANTIENIWKRNHPVNYKSSNARKAVYQMNRFIDGNTQAPAQIVKKERTAMTPEDSQEMMKSYEQIIKLKEDSIKSAVKEQLNTVVNGQIDEMQKLMMITGIIKESELDVKLDMNNITSLDQITTELEKSEIKDKKHMLDFYQSKCRTTLGNCEESTVQELYNKKTGKTILENNSRTFAQKYKTRADLRFVVRGKIDGLVTIFDEDNKPAHKLIEIKNRAARLFGRIPEYEQIQLCFYMKFLNLESAELVERFKEDMNIIEFQYRKDLYKRALKVLSRSVDFMHQLWLDDELVQKYQSMTLDERNSYLNKIMPKF